MQTALQSVVRHREAILTLLGHVAAVLVCVADQPAPAPVLPCVMALRPGRRDADRGRAGDPTRATDRDPAR